MGTPSGTRSTRVLGLSAISEMLKLCRSCREIIRLRPSLCCSDMCLPTSVSSVEKAAYTSGCLAWAPK